MPVIQSGMSDRRLELHRWQPWMAALNLLRLPLLLFDSSGREIHRTAALETLFAAESAAKQERLFTAVQEAVCKQTDASRGYEDVPSVAGTPSPDLAVRVWMSASVYYSVRAVHVVDPACCEVAPGQSMTLVTVEPGTSRFPSEKHLRERYALTRREAEVALLLAQRMPNAEIAEKLSVSVHTTRHHTERVLEKLGIQRRAEVVRVLQSGFAGLTGLALAGAAKFLLVGHEILGFGYAA